ncbi:hypothetical protein MT361_06200 [Clostridium butyricum]|nr:hypothetical protein [Clostridium butyricum]MDI9208142.1 hypothetical protein [Clostridium butyricum]
MRISSNYGLKLMEGTDNVKRQDFVDNFSKIDTEMRAIENEAYPIVEATGTNAYIGANVRIQSLKKGTKLTLFVGTNATGNCSLNLNSYGSKNIKDSNGNIVTNIKANIPYNLCYNGTDFILQGKGGGGNLIPKYLLAGYYGEGDNGRVDGAMVNRGVPTSNLNCGGVVNLQEGYYAGGQIIANSLASQTGGATADDTKVLNGYKYWKDGVLRTGTATIESLGGIQYIEKGIINHINGASNSINFSSNLSGKKLILVFVAGTTVHSAIKDFSTSTSTPLYVCGATTGYTAISVSGSGTASNLQVQSTLITAILTYYIFDI